MDIKTARKRLAAASGEPLDYAWDLEATRQHARANSELRDKAVPALAALILAVEALEAEKQARLATGWQSTCDKQVHGDSHIQCGECFICLERKALAAWRAL